MNPYKIIKEVKAMESQNIEVLIYQYAQQKFVKAALVHREHSVI